MDTNVIDRLDLLLSTENDDDDEQQMSTASQPMSAQTVQLPRAYKRCLHLELELPMDITTYRCVSYYLNVCVYPALCAFGCIGYGLLFARLNTTNRSHTRFAQHIRALCLFDCTLLCCVVAVQLPNVLVNGCMTTYGALSVLLYVIGPVANVSMTSTKWQFIALSIERLWFVVRPLQSRFSSRTPVTVRNITLFIVFIAVVMHTPLYFAAHRLVRCQYADAATNRTVVTQELVRTQVYTDRMYIILFEVLPSLLFDCPTPFFIILCVALLTLRVTKLPNGYGSRQRRDDQQTASTQPMLRRSSRRSCSAGRLQVLLLLLCVKYLLCNSALLVKTIGEVFVSAMGLVPTRYQLTYIHIMLFVDEGSTCLIMLHSATNWLMFGVWAKSDRLSRSVTANSLSMAKRKASESVMSIRGKESLTGPSTSQVHKTSNPTGMPVVTTQEANQLAAAWRQSDWTVFGQSVLQQCCAQRQSLARQVFGDEPLGDNVRLRRLGLAIGCFFDDIITVRLVSSTDAMKLDVARRLRLVGREHYKLGIDLRVAEWKVFKTALIGQLETTTTYNPDDFHDVVVKFVSYAIGQIKQGYIAERSAHMNAAGSRVHNAVPHNNNNTAAASASCPLLQTPYSRRRQSESVKL